MMTSWFVVTWCAVGRQGDLMVIRCAIGRQGNFMVPRGVIGRQGNVMVIRCSIGRRVSLWLPGVQSNRVTLWLGRGGERDVYRAVSK